MKRSLKLFLASPIFLVMWVLSLINAMTVPMFERLIRWVEK